MKQGFQHYGPRKGLTLGEQKANIAFVLRWAMSPVRFLSTPVSAGQRPAQQQTSLFTDDSCARISEHDPKARTGSDRAPISTGPGGRISGCPSPDCPPASPEEHGAPRYADSRT